MARNGIIYNLQQTILTGTPEKGSEKGQAALLPFLKGARGVKSALPYQFLIHWQKFTKSFYFLINGKSVPSNISNT